VADSYAFVTTLAFRLIDRHNNKVTDWIVGWEGVGWLALISSGQAQWILLTLVC